MIVSACCDLHYATFEELAVEDPATALDWLSPAELTLWKRFRSPMRRNTFLAGRILAKRLLRERHCAAQACKPGQITILSNGSGPSGVQPRVTLTGRRLVYSLSISHTCDRVLVGGTNRFGLTVGVDLVRMRRLGAAFERSWLTGSESALLQQNQVDMTVADIWAMKEAVYKACNRGEAFAPKSVEIRVAADGTTVLYHGRNLRERCRVRVWRWGDEVAAVATYRSPSMQKHDRPTELNGHSNSPALNTHKLILHH